VDTSVLSPTRNRRIAWTTAGVTAIIAAALTYPIMGVPVALGACMYASVKLCKPNMIVRGRSLSPPQHQRAAVMMGAGILVIAASIGLALYGLKLANTLEQRLCWEVEAAYERGALKAGKIFEECQQLVCAQATVVQPATRSRLGIVRLSGFAVHNQSVYGWHNPVRPIETAAQQPQ